MRVVIGEDEALLREGLVLMLRTHGIDVVGTAADALELPRVVAAESPDLVITDVRMPPDHADDGLRAALEIRRRAPMPIVILSQYVHRQYLQELMADGAGAVGYLLKQRVSDGRSFCADAERVAAGGTVLDPEVVSSMMARAAATITRSNASPRASGRSWPSSSKGAATRGSPAACSSPRSPSCSTSRASTSSSG